MALGAYSSSILKPAIAWMLVISLDILCRFVQIAINCADQNADRNFEDGCSEVCSEGASVEQFACLKTHDNRSTQPPFKF